jgi:hypothetical protein
MDIDIQKEARRIARREGSYERDVAELAKIFAEAVGHAGGAI